MSNNFAALYKGRLKTFTIIRCAEPSATTSDPIQTPAAACAYLLPFFRKADAGREHVGLLLLDSKHRPIAGKIIFSGTINQAQIFPREIARAALLMGAAAVVLAHNHPSGELDPSADDICMAGKADKALRLLDIRLLDNLILDVTAGRFRSIGVSGMLQADPE